jgi:quercetin dioxygenase-like cupin family protein
MRVVKKGDGEKYVPPGHDEAVTAIKMFDPQRGSPKVDVHITTFEAGTSMEEEVHPDSDHVLYILHGSLEVRQGGKVFTVLSEGDALHVPAGDPHQMANISSGSTTVFMVTVPPV